MGLICCPPHHLLLLLGASCLSLFTDVSACNFGPGCMFPCRCAVGKCDQWSGRCFQGQCTASFRNMSGLNVGWGGHGCLTGTVASLVTSHNVTGPILGIDCEFPTWHKNKTGDIENIAKWWRVDLEEQHYILNVTVFNKDRNAERLNDFYLLVTNSSEVPVTCPTPSSRYKMCHQVTRLVPGSSSDIHECEIAVVGRYMLLYMYGGLEVIFADTCDFVAIGNRYIPCTNCSGTCTAQYGCVTCPAGKQPDTYCTDCADGWYGDDDVGCRRCGRCESGRPCNKHNGTCPYDCKDWWDGSRCQNHIDRLHCPSRVHRSVTWPATAVGKIALGNCPNNINSVSAKWWCQSNPPQWYGEPDLSECVSDSVAQLKQLVPDIKDQAAVEVVLDKLTKLTAGQMYGGDLVAALDVMADMVTFLERKPDDNQTYNKFVQVTTESLLNISSNMLSDGSPWMDLPSTMQSQQAINIIDNVERSAGYLTKTLDHPQTVIQNTENIALQLHIIDTSTQVDNITFPHEGATGEHGTKDTGDTMHISAGALKSISQNGWVWLVFVRYENLNKWLHPQAAQPSTSGPANTLHPTEHYSTSAAYHRTTEEVTPPTASQEKKERLVATNILSAIVITENRTDMHINLTEPIVYTLSHTPKKCMQNPSCSFWEYSKHSKQGSWQTYGCHMTSTSPTHTTCSCDHITNFAVLMDVCGVQSYEHQPALIALTYTGCILSVICLIAAFLTFTCFKSLQSDRNTIHKNLVAVLCVAQVVFLAGIKQTQPAELCTVVAVVLHYCFLVAFMWMLMEGIILYVKLVNVFETISWIKYCYIVAYGVPLAIVGISAAINYKGYGTADNCWLSTENGFKFAFVGPVMAIVCVNGVMLGVAIYKACLYKSSAVKQPHTDAKKRRRQILGVAGLLVLLGLTWVFGVLSFDEHTVVFAYLFTIFNSLQGVFIFVFHCCLDNKVTKEYLRCLGVKSAPVAVATKTRTQYSHKNSSVLIENIHSKEKQSEL